MGHYRIVYEKGLAIRRLEDGQYYCESSGRPLVSLADAGTKAFEEMKSRPVVAQESKEGPSLVFDTGGKCFGIAITGLMQKMAKQIPSFFDTINLTYVLGGG